jgi:hypothetical protein
MHVGNSITLDHRRDKASDLPVMLDSNVFSEPAEPSEPLDI